MPSRAVIQIIAVVIVAVFAAGVWITGGTVEPDWLRYLTVAVLVASGVFWLWDKWLWRTSFAQRVKRVPRNLRGTWQGTLTSRWVDPQSLQQRTPKPAYLVVRQTAWSVSVILLTDESRSISSIGTVSSIDGWASLDYMFLNRPDSRHRSPMHHGSTSLDITGRPATRLRGEYWTNRDTRGELDFTRRAAALAEDFDEAARLFA